MHTRLVSFGERGSERPGALVHDAVLPLGRVLADLGLEQTGSLRHALPLLGSLREGIDAALKRGDEFQVMRMKGWDTFLPTGPWLVTPDEAGDYGDIRIQSWINDEP